MLNMLHNFCDLNHYSGNITINYRLCNNQKSFQKLEKKKTQKSDSNFQLLHNLIEHTY